MKNNNNNYYDNPNIKIYINNNILKYRSIPYCAILLKKYVKGDILDVGAGHGDFTFKLCENNINVKKITCFELNNKNIKLLKNKKCEVKKINLDTYPYIKNTKYDTIISTDVIEHLLSPYLHLLECHRLLNNNGHLIITTPQASKTTIIIQHINYFSPRSLELNLQRVGFKKIIRVYNGIYNEKITIIINKIPIIRNILNNGCYYIAIK